MKKTKFILFFAATIVMFAAPLSVSAAAAEIRPIRDGVRTAEYQEPEEEVPAPEDVFSEEEIQLLLDVAMAEAIGEDVEGYALVMRTVLNRVEDENMWPDTIREVIYQPGQFEVVSIGSLGAYEITEDCYEALGWVAAGWDESHGAEYFCMTYLDFSGWAEYLFTHGCHRFYR